MTLVEIIEARIAEIELQFYKPPVSDPEVGQEWGRGKHPTYGSIVQKLPQEQGNVTK